MHRPWVRRCIEERHEKQRDGHHGNQIEFPAGGLHHPAQSDGMEARGSDPAEAVRETVRSADSVCDPVRAADAVRQPVGPPETVRQSIRPAHAVGQPVRAAAVVREAVRHPGLSPASPLEDKAVREAFLRGHRRGTFAIGSFLLPLGRFRPLGGGRRSRALAGRRRRTGLEFLLDHILDRGMTEVVQFVFQRRGRGELRAAICTRRGVERHRDVAHRTRHREIGRLGGSLALLRSSNPTLLSAVLLAESRVKFRLQDPQTRVVWLDLGEVFEGLNPALRFIERRLHGG